MGVYLSGPYFFILFFGDFIESFYIYIPWSILFTGGITGFIEWRLEFRNLGYNIFFRRWVNEVFPTFLSPKRHIL